MALTPVPITEARPTFLRGFFTRLAVIAATSTPMKENSATLAAIPMQLYKLPPEALNGPKFALRTKNQPTTPTNSSGTNFSTTVMFWNQAICRTPARFTAAGTHRPTSAMPQFARPEGFRSQTARRRKTPTTPRSPRSRPRTRSSRTTR